MTSVYLDAASAGPLHPVARQALRAASEDGWTDPGRRYGQARRARQLWDAAREAVAEVIGVRADEVAFTGSGTAAAHSGVLGMLAGRRRFGDLLLYSAVEHSSVVHAADWHVESGGRAETVPVSRTGRLDTGALSTALAGGGAAAVAVQSANHEVGTRQPIADVVAACGDVPLIVDAAQSLGRESVPDGWSVLTGSARKWGGPAGVGILVVRHGARWRNPWPHDGERFGVPSGANIPSVVAAAAALRAVWAQRRETDARLRSLVDDIRRRVAGIPYLEVVGDPVDRLPHIVTFSYPFEDGEPLAAALDAEGFAVSAGSSCTSSTLRPSHVLEAMGVLSHGNIRVSLPTEVSAADVDRFTTVLPTVVARLRGEAGVGPL